MFVCLGSLILSFTCNFFAYFKFHSDWGRVIGKIKQNELDCRDTAPLNKGTREGDKGKGEITSQVPDTDVLWTASTAREVWCVVFVLVW